ncbi:MAG TPA: VOC family protein [Nevskia sp.]|nr:VOC family protein [Nevskia sp.]
MKTKLMLCPVEDLDAAVAFYHDVLGLPVKFRDGGRYCALDAGGYTLGLAAREERIVDNAAPAFHVEDLDAAVAAMLASGASMVRPPERGPHELRAVLRVPGGNTVVLSAGL